MVLACIGSLVVLIIIIAQATIAAAVEEPAVLPRQAILRAHQIIVALGLVAVSWALAIGTEVAILCSTPKANRKNATIIAPSVNCLYNFTPPRSNHLLSMWPGTIMIRSLSLFQKLQQVLLVDWSILADRQQNVPSYRL